MVGPVPVKSCPLCHDAVNAVLAELGPTRLKGSVTVTAHPETGETMLWASPGMGPCLSRRFANVNAPRDPRPRARFEVDGVQMKVRLDFGCGWIDHRGWFRVG